ncbi:MAG TPA: hypothetical protein VIL12_03655 [Acidimicrobiia bacterium]
MKKRVVYGFPGHFGPGHWGPPPPMMWMHCGPRWSGQDFLIHVDEDELESLEELQRDLEEAAADVADRIRRLKERQAEKP